MPAGPPFYQVIEGDLVMSPSPNIYHQALVGRIYSLLLQFLEKKPLGEVFVAPLDVFLSDINVYQPDVISFPISGADSYRARPGRRAGPGGGGAFPGNCSGGQGLEAQGLCPNWRQGTLAGGPGCQVDPRLPAVKDAETPAATYDEKVVFGSPLLPGLRLKAASIFKSPLRK